LPHRSEKLPAPSHSTPRTQEETPKKEEKRNAKEEKPMANTKVQKLYWLGGELPEFWAAKLSKEAIMAS
jgi:hypothetical protein